MGLSREDLLTRLKELQIDFSQYDHPVVLTVEEQAKYIGHLGGGISKNLFLKDKKNRFYVVSALADTKVDLKVLSVRLGLGKGGLRMAPEEALGEILQIPLGCVTPLSLVNESARNVSLLLDQKFKSQEFCFFHPLSNDMSISLTIEGLDKFLKSIQRDSSYVDLEANPTVGKDQPPDLASLVPSSAIILQDPPATAASSKGPTENKVSAGKKPATTTASSSKPSINAKTSKKIEVKPANVTDVGEIVDNLLNSTCSLLLEEITEENIVKLGEQLGEVLSKKIKSKLAAELHSTVMIFKNTAYTEGFHAGVNSGVHSHPKY